MKKIILFLILTLLTFTSVNSTAEASLISSAKYRHEQQKENKKDIQQIKELFKVYTTFANKHDIKAIAPLYADNYINNDGFNKEAYLKSAQETWDECKDITYEIKILSIEIKGDHATVDVDETAVGTVFEKSETFAVAGEIHAKSKGLYNLIRINGRWLISGETIISDESSLLYGDARFMNIELFAPNQVSSGESYTTTVKVDAGDDTVIVGSIEHDPIMYPSDVPNGPLRTMPESKILERVIKANTDNLNEYTVASLAISKAKPTTYGTLKVYLAGMACIMKRVNVIPKNNFIKLEEKDKKTEEKI